VAVSGILLDTSGYRHLMSGHPDVAERVRTADRVALNSVVVGELRSAFRRGSARKRNEQFLESFLSRPTVDFLAVDRDTTECYAFIGSSLQDAGIPVPANDLWIAASAMQHGLRLVTTDADFLRIPQIRVDHFESPGGRPLLRPKAAKRGR
jgi:tRNA(fMet)-specific endonuclease VapC